MKRSALLLMLVAIAAASAPGAQARGPHKAHASIAGGYYPDPAVWPWVTALVDPTAESTTGDLGRSVCTAVLIAPQRVLTAAHCVVGDDNATPLPPNRFQALVGRRSLSDDSQGERHNVTGVVVHPKLYLPQSGVHIYHAFYDLAVLFLDTPSAIQPATIGSPDDWNTWATVMGWGHWNYDHDNPQYDANLRAADFDLLNDKQCASYFDDPDTQHFFPSIHVCANNPPGDNYDCITHGDSGGPLMVKMTYGWRLIGITSFYPHRADRCGAGGPFGFAWVAGNEMRDWPLTVEPPPPVAPAALDLSMSRSQAVGYVKSMIRDNTNGRVTRLKRGCARTSDRGFACRLSWRIGRRAYSGRAHFWHYEENGEPYWTYVFTGQRRTAGCSGCGSTRLKW